MMTIRSATLHKQTPETIFAAVWIFFLEIILRNVYDTRPTLLTLLEFEYA